MSTFEDDITEGRGLTPAEKVLHEAFQKLMDQMQEDEVAHVTISVEWGTPEEEGDPAIWKKATADIQIDDPCEAEVEGMYVTTTSEVTVALDREEYHP